jgi:hypothetical protein
MATTTNYGWTTPDDTALVKDGAAAIRTLGSSIDTTTKNLNPETTLGDIAYRSSTANTNTRLAIGPTGQILTVAGGVPSWATPAGASTNCAVFIDQKTSTAGGTFTSGAWRTRDINTSQFNNITGASISSNQITLPAGTFMVVATAPFQRVDQNVLRFQNITDTTTAIEGQNAYTDTGAAVVGIAYLSGIFTIAGSKTFELQHRCFTTRGGDGFGASNTITTDVYSIVSIWKVG